MRTPMQGCVIFGLLFGSVVALTVIAKRNMWHEENDVFNMCKISQNRLNLKKQPHIPQ